MIKRYDLDYDDFVNCDEHGEWVRYDDHAAEVELLSREYAPVTKDTWENVVLELGRLRGENERHRAEVERLRELLECTQGDRDTWERMYYENRDAQREATIYGTVFANVYLRRGIPAVSIASEIATQAANAWRAAQKGGSDG